MRTKITFLLLVLTSCTLLKAQSISVTHLFSGEVVPYVSKGNTKLGWVSTSGNYYASNLMDSMQNITTFLDTSLFVISGGFPANGGGVTLCGSTVNSNDNLIGMFYDWDCWMDSTMIFGPFLGSGCYFLYDFATQQRNYFYFNTPTFVQPQDPNYDCDYHFNWKNDTLIVTLQFTDQTFSGSNHGYCLKFVNNQLVEEGELFVLGYVVDVFIDPSEKLNQLYDQNTGGFWMQNDGVNYSNDLTSNNTTYYADAFVDGNDMYILQNHFSVAGESDSIIHYNSTSQTAIASPMTGVYASKVLCRDHAGRIWVAKNDSVYMYNGSNWHAFGFGGINLQNQLVNPTFIKSFIEYKTNCFALSFSEDLLPVGGNGMLLFCYSDSSMVTTVINKINNSSISFYPNPAFETISSSNLSFNDKVIFYNILGAPVYTYTCTENNRSIDISEYPAGIYFIELVRENQSITIQKIIISKN